MREIVRRCLVRQKAIIRTSLHLAANQLGAKQPRSFVVFDDLGLAYLNIPKSACSTIKYELLKNSIGERAEEFKHGQSRYNWTRHAKPSQFDSTHVRFTIVRNPYSRILSMYKDKFESAHKRNKKFKYSEYLGGILHQNMTFEEVVNEIADIPDYLADDHFRSQYDFCYDGNICVVEHVWKLEETGKDADEIFKATGLTLFERLNNTSSGSLAEYYSDKIAEKVHRRYEKDFSVFGYDTAVPL